MSSTTSLQQLPENGIKQREVSLCNIIRQAIAQTPKLPTTLKGLAALIATKPQRQRSIGLLLEQHAARQPEHIAVRFEGITYSYGELNLRANQLAHFLASQAVHSGDAVGILLENRPETLIAVLATVKLGAIAAMLNTSQRGEVLLHSINLVKPKLIICGEEVVEHLSTVESQLPVELATQLYYWRDHGQLEKPAHYQDIDAVMMAQPCHNPASTAQVKMHQPCYYIFTSGTTGMPKASVMSHYRWHKSMAGMGLASMKLTKKDTLYVSLPLYHNNALTVSLAAVLGAGGCIAIARKFSASRFWDDIRRHQATAFCYIGELCRYLLNRPEQADDRQHSVRVVVGNGLRPEIWMAFKQRFGIEHINEFYGASECNLVFTNAFNLDKTAGVCPLPYSVVEFDIEEDTPKRNDQGFMTKVARGSSGLLITEINDKQPFEGYTDAEATEKKLLRDVFKPGDCWFNTGDLVINQGFRHIAFADRTGDTFRWKGENVATTEVESILMEFPGIEHAVVYGVEVPDCDGRAGMAALTLNIDANHLDWGRLTRHLQEKLPHYAIPVFMRLSQQAQVTGTFKYRKVELKQEAYYPERVSGPVWWLAPHTHQYQPLTGEQAQQLRNL
ncbi:putative fatty-acid-CoA ligase FadD [Bacterioplanes sanyensis]|uniref:long-chain-acyl-CoA synthetase n=1 Tax=Bacterioplanes sanyensis TaxID=1249553 RepID=UPI001675B8E5|nr:long-chain-acyl-CoA synthetase [Bacterioplanes sanyensis]GGY33803.1 putative fatty-acid-CoA ligase FadD [Bacterioplanes sanyensis]